MSAASGVNRAASEILRTAPRSSPRTSSSVMTSFADSSRVTVPPAGLFRGGLLLAELPAWLGAHSDSAGIVLLKTSRTSARTRSLVASSAILYDQRVRTRTDSDGIEAST